jgi:hypothetical protein
MKNGEPVVATQADQVEHVQEINIDMIESSEARRLVLCPLPHLDLPTKILYR